MRLAALADSPEQCLDYKGLRIPGTTGAPREARLTTCQRGRRRENQCNEHNPLVAIGTNNRSERADLGTSHLRSLPLRPLANPHDQRSIRTKTQLFNRFGRWNKLEPKLCTGATGVTGPTKNEVKEGDGNSCSPSTPQFFKYGWQST